MGLFVATKAFFKCLVNREFSHSFQQLLEGKLVPKIATDRGVAPDLRTDSKSRERVESKPTAPTRSDALSLLSALQREARFVDLINEPLDAYSDAQIGAAARDILKNTGGVVQRMFHLVPLTEIADGDSFSTPPDFDPAEYRLTGNISGTAPFTGSVAHHGWKATKCEVPQWKGKHETMMIVSPVELEVN